MGSEQRGTVSTEAVSPMSQSLCVQHPMGEDARIPELGTNISPFAPSEAPLASMLDTA